MSLWWVMLNRVLCERYTGSKTEKKTRQCTRTRLRLGRSKERQGEDAIKKWCLIKIASGIRIMELNVTDWELFLWLHPEYGRKVFNGFANELMAINFILLSMDSFRSSRKLSFLFKNTENILRKKKTKRNKMAIPVSGAYTFSALPALRFVRPGSASRYST